MPVCRIVYQYITGCRVAHMDNLDSPIITCLRLGPMGPVSPAEMVICMTVYHMAPFMRLTIVSHGKSWYRAAHEYQPWKMVWHHPVNHNMYDATHGYPSP